MCIVNSRIPMWLTTFSQFLNQKGQILQLNIEWWEKYPMNGAAFENFHFCELKNRVSVLFRANAVNFHVNY